MGENLEEMVLNGFGTKNGARRLFFFFFKLLECSLGLRFYGAFDFKVISNNFNNIKNYILRSTRGWNIEKLTNHKIYHSTLFGH